MSTIIKARSPFHIRTQNLVAEPVLVNLTCADIDITGFEVNQDGVITIPTAKIIEGQTAITIDSTSPASFDIADVSIPRTLYCTMTVPSGYKNATEEIVCNVEAIQESQAVRMQCKTMRIFNNSSTETLTVKYVACGNIEKTQVIATQDSEDLCVNPLSEVTWYSGSLEWGTLFVSRGCVTGVAVYGISGILPPYPTRAAARTARNQSSFYLNVIGTMAWVDDITIQGTFGITQGTLTSLGSAIDTDSNGTFDTLRAPYLKDGWYALNVPSSFTDTGIGGLQVEVRTVDSVVVEGGFTFEGGAILDPL